MIYMLFIFAALVLGLTFAEYKNRESWQKWLKPAAALTFIALALLGGAVYWEYGRWILAALTACAVGDVLLLSRDSERKFMLGMAAFALGHSLYIAAFLHHPGFNFTGYLIAIIPVLAGFIYFSWIMPKLPPDFKFPVAVYAMIIITMVILSFGLPGWMIPLAAILFAISDMFVARDRFVDQQPVNALAITPLYFGAQSLFALSAGF